MSKNPRRVTLAFQPVDADKHRNLSAVVQVGDDLWIGSDEGTCVERLRPVKDGFGEHATFKLGDFVDLPADEDEEVDVEGMACAGEYLWVAGSHSVRRKKADGDGSQPKKRLRRLARVARGGNRYLLARIPLLRPEGAPTSLAREAADAGGAVLRRAARLAGRRRGNALTDALADDEHLADSLAVPGKDNGFDVEGLAVAGERVFLGLRGPVLRGWAAVLCVQPEDDPDEPGTLRLAKVGPKGRRYDKHFLDLRGLGVRELCADGDDLLVLAGPTMTLDGRCVVLRWRDGLRATGDTIVDRDALERVLELPYGVGEEEGVDHPEGMALVTVGGKRGLLVVHDAPSEGRRRDDGRVEADLFELKG